jgi:hypothetical protein
METEEMSNVKTKRKKYVSRNKILDSTKYSDKMIAASEAFNNVWYQIEGKAISINAIINDRVVAIPGTMADMRRLTKELNEVIDVYGDL